MWDYVTTVAGWFSLAEWSDIGCGPVLLLSLGDFLAVWNDIGCGPVLLSLGGFLAVFLSAFITSSLIRSGQMYAVVSPVKGC